MLAPIDLALWFVTAAFSLIALSRIVALQLWRRQPMAAFCFLLLVSIVRDIALWRIPYNTKLYALIWEAFLPLLLCSHAWCAFSTYRAVVGLYPNIGRFAIWLFWVAFAVAALGCVATLPVELHRIGGNELFVRSMFLAHRWVDGLSAGSLIVACAFLAYFPRPMERVTPNLLRHTALLASYFSAYALTALAENLYPMGSAIWIERAQFAFVALLYGGWTLGLSSQGERSVPWPALTPGVEKFLRDRARFARELGRRAAGAT